MPGVRQITSQGTSTLPPGIQPLKNDAVKQCTTDSGFALDPNAGLQGSTLIGLSGDGSSPIDTRMNPPQSSPKCDSGSTLTRKSITKQQIPRPNSKPPLPNKQAFAGLSRLKRKNPKLSLHPRTDVDWNEDLRPTEDEQSFEGDSNLEGTEVPSPDPEPSPVVHKKPRRKREAPKAKPGSGKRQKAMRKGSTKQGNLQSDQLLLTADASALSQSRPLAAHANSTTRLSDGQLNSTGSRRATDSPATSFPFSETDKRNHPKTNSPPTGIIEILSSSSLSSKPSSPGHGIDSLRDEGQRVKAELHGRGERVGQKLADALRQAGLQASCSSAAKVQSRSTQIFAGGTPSRVPSNPSELVLEALAPLAPPAPPAPPTRNPFMSQLEMEQDESRWGVITNSHLRQTETSAETSGLHGPNPLVLQGLLNSTGSVDSNFGREAVDDRYEAFDNPLQGTHLPESMAIELTRPSDDFREIPQAGMQPLASQPDTSSQSSAVRIHHNLLALPVQGRGSDYTPESQKPLLSLQTPLQAIFPHVAPRSIPRSSIVDRNGSPRLRIRTNMELEHAQLCLNTGRLQSTSIADTSSSEYNRDSDTHETDSESQSGRTRSKFQRDMFMEYGFGPEELTTERTRLRTFKDCVLVDSLGGAGATEGDDDLPHVSDECSVIKEGISGNDTHEASAVAPDSSQGSIGETRMEYGLGPDNFQRGGTRLSTGNSGSGSHHSLLQDGSDNMEWISNLQKAQRSAHSLLLENNQHLSCQLAAEQETIRQVLQFYRQGCIHILDDLRRAQAVRMELYRQQMSSVEEEHTQLCQDLLRGLQDHRLQQGQ
ncbi:uncharacterized protein N7482_003272 [Penicillium canariense]|uniref:Uncharacterized protein n=1 Tax=Penicillium canariense TaxID=189055 RepID=A0A9W9LPF4_9EURO|nr:uncharacterized protein N7482_003272 [Penicillium canariense]KAJ5167678.1 hypothetical protein N7482_003272 [Penicillium canariense]